MTYYTLADFDEYELDILREKFGNDRVDYNLKQTHLESRVSKRAETVSDEDFEQDIFSLREFLWDLKAQESFSQDDLIEVKRIMNDVEHGYRKGAYIHSRVENKEYRKGGSKYKNGLGSYHNEKRGVQDSVYILKQVDRDILEGKVPVEKIK